MTFPDDPTTGLPRLPNDRLRYSVSEGGPGYSGRMTHWIFVLEQEIDMPTHRTVVTRGPWWKFFRKESHWEEVPSKFTTKWTRKYATDVPKYDDANNYVPLTKELIHQQCTTLRYRLEEVLTSNILLGTYPPKSL